MKGDAEDGDADYIDLGDFMSPASHTHSKGRKLSMSCYVERDADEDSEEEYPARSDDGSDNNDEKDSEAGAGKCHSTSFFCIFLPIQNIMFYSENALCILFLL